MTRYTVTVLRSGQPRPYADTEREYLIKVEDTGWKPTETKFEPWLMHGNLDQRIAEEEAARKAGRMFGGNSPDELRKMQRDWALKIIRALCQDFREPNDNDGRTGMEAHFYPTLKRLDINQAAGEIRVLIIEPYTD